MKNKETITLESAIESDKFGFAVTYDGDNHQVLFGTKCNCCNEYFEGKDMVIYCDECIKTNSCKTFGNPDGMDGSCVYCSQDNKELFKICYDFKPSKPKPKRS